MATYTSILADVKDYCMVPQEADIYNNELCGHINAAFFTLFQLGCTAKPFSITDETATWTDFTDNLYISSIALEYVKKKVRMLYDPPSNSFLVNQLKDELTEMESRISYAVDPGWEELNDE